MKKKIFIAGSIILLLFALILSRNFLYGFYKKNFYASSCDQPIKYSIGSIDPEFKVTRAKLLEDVKSAANIWNTTVNKTLFEYDPNAKFTINMVYDERQKLSKTINDLNSDLTQKQEEIDPKIDKFLKDQDNLEQRIKSLNERISYWNSQGGAPADEYKKLVDEQQKLKDEADALNLEAQKLGQQTREYNSSARTLNKTINQYQNVLEYKPEEGLYEQDGSSRKISIYLDVDQEEFLHTLAHELGHALGIDHINNKDAIMYPQTTSDLTPSSEEIDVLRKICEPRSYIQIFRERMILGLSILSDKLKPSNSR